jgi:hypothetical protein
VQANPDGYLDLWAREHYKSTIITFGLTIQNVLADPELTVGIFSHTRPIAKGFLRQIKREFEGNDSLKGTFPDVLYAEPHRESPKWSEDDGITVKRKGNPKEATIEAWGLVDGQPTSKHYKLRVYDDVVTKESVSTPEQVAKTTEAWELSSNLGSEGGRVRYIGTRYSFADTYQAVLDRHAAIPRIHAATDDGTKEGKPVFFSEGYWQTKLTDQSDATIACQMLQNPIAGQQAMFDVKDLQYYEIRPKTLNVYIMVDPARSQKKDSANTAMVVLGYCNARRKWLLDGLNHRMKLSERWESMVTLRRYWMNEPGVGSVTVGYETYGAQADMDYFEEQMTKVGPRFDIVELAWTRDGENSKIDRVQRLQPDIKKGHFLLPGTFKETSTQKQVKAAGEGYRVAKPIRKKDPDGNVYDLGAQMVQQIHFFPFGGLKDLVDAASRIYDIEPVPPIMYDIQQLEPEAFIDS